MENQVSIILNGVRYDAVQMDEVDMCECCDLHEKCDAVDHIYSDSFTHVCFELIGYDKIFKKVEV